MSDIKAWMRKAIVPSIDFVDILGLGQQVHQVDLSHEMEAPKRR
jgi:hypothetical protein